MVYVQALLSWPQLYQLATASDQPGRRNAYLVFAASYVKPMVWRIAPEVLLLAQVTLDQQGHAEAVQFCLYYGSSLPGSSLLPFADELTYMRPCRT